MSDSTVINQLSRLFSENDSNLIVRSLHRDSLVWKSLEEPSLVERLTQTAKSDINKWTPGAIAALLLEPSEDLTGKLINPTYNLPETLKAKSLAYYQSLVNTGLYPESLSQAGLLALTVRDHFQLQSEWSNISVKVLIKKNINNQEYHFKLWHSAFSCLIDYIEDYSEFATTLIKESPVQFRTQIISLVLHGLLCKPMPEFDLINAIFDLFSRLGTLDQIASIKYLESTDLDTTFQSKLAGKYLELNGNLVAVSTAISEMDHSEIFLKDNQLNNDPGVYSNMLNLINQAELCKYAGLVEQSNELRARAIELLNQNQAKLYNQIGIENSTKDPHLAKTAFQKAQLSSPGLDQSKIAYARFLIDNQEFEEAREILFSVAETPETRFLEVILRVLHNNSDNENRLSETIFTEYFNSIYFDFHRNKNDLIKAIDLLKSSHHYESAYNIVKTLLQNRPNDLLLLGYSSDLLQFLGQPQKALDVTELMQMIYPENDSITYKLANLLIQTREWKRAFDIYHKLIQSSNSPSRSDLLTYANIAVEAGKPEIAIPICTNFLNLDKLDCDALVILGNAYIASGKKSAAIEYMERATSLSPEKASSWLALANIWTKMEDFDHALDVLLKAKSALPDDPQILKALGISYMNSQLVSNALPFLNQAYTNKTDDIQTITNLADAFLQLGNIKDAQKVLDNSPFNYTADPKLALITGKVLCASNEFLESQPILRFAYQSENSEDSLVAYTNLLLQLSENSPSNLDQDYLVSELTQVAEKILDCHHDSKEPFKLLLLLADVNLALGAEQEAYDRYVALLNQPESRSSQAYQQIQYGIGLSALKLNLSEISLAALQEAVMCKPDDPKLRRALALAFIQSNLPEEGFECAQAAVQIASEDIENVLWYSDFVIANGQPKLAISSLQNAIQKSPSHRSLYLKLAQTYVLEGNHSEAKNVIERMVRVEDITDQEIHKAADIYLQLNEFEDATRLLKNAILLHSKPDFNILHDLAYSLALLGDFDGSVELINNYTSDFNNDDRFNILKSDIFSYNMQYTEALKSLEPILQRIEYQFDISKIANRTAISNMADIDYSKSGVFHRKVQLDRISGDLYNVQAFIDKAINEDPLSMQNQLLAMETYYSLGNNLLAIKCFENILASQDSINTPSSVVEKAVSLRCEIALDNADYKTASELFSDHLSQTPPSSSSLAIQSRISNYKKENSLAEKFFDDAFNSIKEETQSQNSSLKSIQTQFEFIWNNFALAKTAQELQMWDTAYELFLRIIAKVQIIPIVNFAFAEFLIYAFQNQKISNDLKIVTHAASFDSESDEFRSLLNSQISNVSRFIDEKRITSFKVKANAILDGYWPENEPLKDHIKTSLDAIAILPILSSDEHISEILDAFPSDFNVAFQIASISLNQDREKCNRQIKELFVLDTTYPPLYALQAFCNADDLYVSTQSMETALSFWPDEPDWHCFLAEQYMKNSQFGLAAHHLEISIDLKPDQAYYWQLLGEVKLQEKDIAAAKSYFSKACDIFPENPEALFSLGQMNRKLGDLKSALECFEKSLELKPDYLDTSIALVNVLLDKGANEKGLAIISALLSANPNNVDIQTLVIDALIANNEIEEANETLKGFIKLNSESIPLKLKQIELVTICSGNEAAIPLLLELSEENPDDTQVQLQFATALIKSNDLDLAENVMQQSLLMNPDQANMHLSLGRIKRKKGQLDQAISVLSKAITLDPSLLDAYIELGITHQNRREQKQAIEVFQRAAQIAPNDHRPLYHSGLAYRECKDYKNAEIMLRNAAQLAPNDPSIRRQLAGVIALNLVHNLQESRNYEHHQ